MAEKFVIKREWRDSVIKVGVDTKEIRIECSIEAFERRLEDKLLSLLPNMMLKGHAVQRDMVRACFRKAWDDTTQEFKDETVRMP